MISPTNQEISPQWNKLKGDLSLKQLKSKSKSLGKFGKDSARVQLL